MKSKHKLFRAIVVMGAAVTTPACDEDTPRPDAAHDAVATTDARTDAPTDGPTDAGVTDAVDADVVIIL